LADGNLRYEPVAQIIARCSAAGVAAIRLTQPETLTPPVGREWPGLTRETRSRARPGEP
jgi:hypothetical protein